MKKFYKTAEAGTAPGGYAVRLDGKNVKTPLGRALLLPTHELAKEIAAEWNAQGAEIIPATMPLTQLANTMLDKAAGDDRAAMNAEIVKYASSDLVCYFASHPADLVARQEECWLPLLAWMKDTHGAALETVRGIQYVNQPAEAIFTVTRVVDALPPAEFTAAQAVMGATGSAVIALAVVGGGTDAETAWKAACVDEIYQLEKWGEDTLARQRLDRIKTDIADAARFLTLLKPSS